MTNHASYLHSRHFFEKIRLLYSSIKYIRKTNNQITFYQVPIDQLPIQNLNYFHLLKLKLNLNDGMAFMSQILSRGSTYILYMGDLASQDLLEYCNRMLY